MKRTIRLTESELRGMIQEAVEEAINNEELNEGLWNQLKTGASTLFKNSNGGNLKSRWSAATKNYQTQGQLDKIDNIQVKLQKAMKELQELIDNGILTPKTTIEQILSQGGRGFNSFTGKRANLKNQLYGRGLKNPKKPNA